MKNAFSSKTVWLGLLTTILPIVLNYATPEFMATIGITNPVVVSLIGVLIVWLRKLTDSPITFGGSK